MLKIGKKWAHPAKKPTLYREKTYTIPRKNLHPRSKKISRKPLALNGLREFSKIL